MTDQKRHATISGLTIRVNTYRDKWKPKLGEKLAVARGDTLDTETPETGIIEVLRTDNGKTVGRVPQELWGYFSQFLCEDGHITAEVINTKFKNRNGVEIFCDYVLQGPCKASTRRILQELQQALQGPELTLYSPSMVIKQDEYCCYFHHAVSKAPDIESKCKAMSKFPNRIRTRASTSQGTSVDPCSFDFGETSPGGKHTKQTSPVVVTDHVPRRLSRQKVEEPKLPDVPRPETTETNGEKTVSDDLVPDELDNDPWTRQIYESAIEQGQEKDYTMRLMIIGCYKQGKSSLAKRLMGQSVSGVQSTNGIEVNVCELSNRDGTLQFRSKPKGSEDAASESIKRLVSVARSNSSASLKSIGTDTNEEDPTDGTLDTVDMETDSGGVASNQILKRKSSVEYSCTNKIRVSKMKIGQDVNEAENEGASPAKKKIDTENVKRFSTELRKSGSFEKEFIDDSTRTMSIWDFGGQFVYYATHQLFHSRHAIYLLVFSLSQDLDEVVQDDERPNKVKPKTMKDYIKFWISSVHSFVGNEHGTEPCVILVGTHKDVVDSDVDIDEKFEEVRKLFEGSKMMYHIYQEQFAVSNVQSSDDEIVRLCKTLHNLVNEHCKNNSIPARWIPLERKLKENQDEKIITFDTVLQFDNENEIPIDNKDQVKLFLQYHHARGTFFYFDDNVEPQHVVLDPQYIVDAFKCLITSERFCIVRPSLRALWHKLCDKAILDKELLHDVWNRDQENEFLKFEDVLIFFLQKHRIIAEALKYDENGTINKAEPIGFYIVPSLLNNQPDGAVEEFMKGKKHTNISLVYVFAHEAIVPTIYYKVTAAACGKWPLIEYHGQPMIFETVTVFKLSLDHAGLLKLHTNSLELLVLNLCPPHRVSVDESDLFRRFVEMVFSQELRKFSGTCLDKQEQCMFSVSLRCYHIQHKFSGSDNIQDLEVLKQYNKRRVGCPDNGNHSLNYTKVLKEWYKPCLDPSKIPKRELTRIELSTLSMSFDENWQQLGLQLGFSKAKIEHIDMTRKLTTSMKIFEMLTQWVNRDVEEATLDVLIGAIHKCKRVLKVDKDVLKNLTDGLIS